MKKGLLVGLLLCVTLVSGASVRDYWASKAHQMAYPVLKHLSQGRLKRDMPQEHPLSGDKQFNKANTQLPYTHLEAVGRTLCGVAPWLECVSDSDPRRLELLELAHQGIRHAVDSTSADFLEFRRGRQPLVDAAFLAQAFLRSPNQLWGGLDETTQRNVIRELKHTRRIVPNQSNWLLFSATIESFLASIGESYQVAPIQEALDKMEQWYVGDAMYGDGPNYHADYYNSYVIQPMLVDIVRALGSPSRPTIEQRAGRYAEVLERSISPEGTFPVVGRSTLYRTGAMQSLAQAALLGLLDPELSQGQVRAALTAVIRKMLDAPRTYDPQGWLTLGFVGDAARRAGESYLSTGSMYLASTVFLPLGLSADHSFWTAADEAWTAKKAWGGESFPIDGALKGS